MINERTIQIGQKYRVIKHLPLGFGPADIIEGSIGICKWGNYRGACLKFTNYGYVIPYDCLGEVDEKLKTIFRSVPTFNTAVINQFRYRLSKLPNEGIQLVGKIGNLCKIRWINRMPGHAEVQFENGECYVVSLELLQDVGT